MQPLARGLLSHLPDDPSTPIVVVKTEESAIPITNGQKPASPAPVYDPGTVFILEFCTTLALRDQESVKVLGNDTADALQNILRDAPNYHPTMVSRTVFYVLELLRASYVSFLIPMTKELVLI